MNERALCLRMALNLPLCFGLVDPVVEGYSSWRQQTGGFPQTPLPIQLRQPTILRFLRRPTFRHLTVNNGDRCFPLSPQQFTH